MPVLFYLTFVFCVPFCVCVWFYVLWVWNKCIHSSCIHS